MLARVRIALASCRDLPAWEVDDRPLHAALRGRGADVTVAAWDDPAVAWAGFDGVLIRTTWDYSERREEFVAWAERAGAATRLFNPPAIVRWNTHKGYLRDLEAEGARLAPTIWLRQGEAVDVAALVRARGWTRAFLKPQVGASARATLRFAADPEGLAAAQAHVERLLAGEDLMLQPYLASVEDEGEVSVIFVDGRPTHGVRKIPVPGDYRVQDDHGGRDVPWQADAATLAECARLVEAAARGGPPLLYARVDLLRAGDGALALNELEAVEPSLFFRHGPAAAEALAEALIGRIAAG